MPAKKVLFFLSFVTLLSCSYNARVEKPSLSEKTGKKEYSRYSIVFIIHGDDSYVYHDNKGNRYYADRRALAQAKAVGQSLNNSEVFIFHLKPKAKFLFFFEKKDGNSFYYRNGELHKKQNYFWAKTDSAFGFESRFYSIYSNQSRHTKSLLFYYGHEIAEIKNQVYNKSHPNQRFSMPIFARGLENLYTTQLDRGKPVDLLTLSVCYGGTPGIISTLSKYTRYVLTSPGNLHLSYIDSKLLIPLLNNSSDDFKNTVEKYVRVAFNHLKERTETMVSLGLYDTSVLEKNLGPLISAYSKQMNQVTTMARCVDCQTDSVLKDLLPENGVQVFYRAPRFGKAKNKHTHSGWGCWEPVSDSF